MGRRNGIAKFMEKRTAGYFKIQITSMVDMFVIILVFLLKSYGSTSVEVAQSPDLRLPVSTSQKPPVEFTKIMVSKANIMVDEQEAIRFAQNGEFKVEDVEANDPMFIRNLFTVLDKQATKGRMIAKENEEFNFEGKVLLIADRSVPYAILKKVMYTAMMAGYADVKIAVMSPD